MTIEFIFGERESLMGKAEYYKASVRSYLEALGYSQTTDSFVEGSFQDMVFLNPTINPGKEFYVEAKAENVSLKSTTLAKELVKYYRLWSNRDSEQKFQFMLFMQGVKKASQWKSLFSEVNNEKDVIEWCVWYNTKCIGEDATPLTEKEILAISTFFSTSIVKVASAIKLDLAVLEKKRTSQLHITRYGKKLLDLTEKRRNPTRKISRIITNILPVKLPDNYYVAQSKINSKQKIYDEFRDEIIPPFLFHPTRKIITTFSPFKENDPLTKICKNINSLSTNNLRLENSTLLSQLIHIHLRRIVWNRGIYRDTKARIYYYPMLDRSKDERKKLNYTGNKVWVVKKYTHQKDTEYVKKGDINFYRHKGFGLRTPTYWKESYIELVPRKYYTLDGEHTIDGDIRSKIDARFRNPIWNRSVNRLQLIKFWKYQLFDSSEWAIEPEQWFELFEAGDFVSQSIKWSPMVIGRDQSRLWDHFGSGKQ